MSLCGGRARSLTCGVAGGRNPRDVLTTNFHLAEDVVAKFPKTTATITSKEDKRP